ncbi:MAG: 6,7-dimethyl-8-ribityllumazine synthase [Pseudobdellovibrionaceae bacterium]
MAKAKKAKRTIAPKKSKIRIAVVTARFNEEITYKLEEGALGYLEQLNDDGFSIEIASLRVPGAVEIPLACQKLFELGFDGVVTCGAVIRGETSHYDYVCNSVTDGLTRLMLDYGKPIGFGVLTTENDEQAMDRCGGKHGNKGQEAAQVVVEMIGLLRDLEKSH